jgi:hypothetical protein
MRTPAGMISVAVRSERNAAEERAAVFVATQRVLLSASAWVTRVQIQMSCPITSRAVHVGCLKPLQTAQFSQLRR